MFIDVEENMKKHMAVYTLCGMLLSNLSFAQTFPTSMQQAKELEFLKGFTFGGGITLNLQNLQNSNYVKDPADPEAMEEDKHPTQGQYSIDLEIEKEFDDKNKAFLHLETGRGDINEYLKSVASINRDADDSGHISVTEAWLEHQFTDKLALSIGVLDPTLAVDENAYANDETKQFIGSMFRNAANISFPDNAFGVKGTYQTDIADFTVQYTDANDYKDIVKYGFASAQVNFKPNFIKEKEGNYRLYAWANTNDHDKLKGTGKGKEYGAGISLDQQFTDIFGGFARYSWSRGDLDNDISGSHTWSVGLQAKFKGIGEEDEAAIACGQVIPSHAYKDHVNKNAKSEKHLEVYYTWNVTDYLAISPDFQLVANPFYNGNDKTAYVSSVRMQISF